MATRYRLYYIEEEGRKTFIETVTKKQLLKFKFDSEEINLFELAERMMAKFNRGVAKGESKRYAYKLEKVTVQVIGSQPYYGLNISTEMCEAEF
jgi:hypothetical protein